MTKTIQNTITEAITYVRSQQSVDGGFNDAQGKSSIFYTGLIVNCLKEYENSVTTEITTTAVEFLLSHQHVDGAWSYNPEYPADLDDTFVAWRAIALCRPELLNEETLARIVSLLIRQEQQPGGPYQTWIMPEKAAQWDDIDIVVNSNIATFFKALDIHLGPMQEYFDQCIQDTALHSRYYDHEIIVLYFIALHYQGNRKQHLSGMLLSKRTLSGHWGNPLHTACAITALLHLGQDPQSLAPAIQYLVDTGNAGIWPSEHLFIEHIDQDNITYSACGAHVSACCLQALALFQKITAVSSPIADSLIREKAFIQQTHKACRERISEPSLRTDLDAALATLDTKDPAHEIPLISYHFARLLCTPHDISDDRIQLLSVANTLGWIGYCIYDKLLDGEPLLSQLPLANACVRQVHQILHDIIPSQYHIVERILCGIDAVTLWEHTHCKIGCLPAYGDYHTLAEKSLGHALGPIMICMMQHRPLQAEYIEFFFRHYLIARQLHDDAHDWIEDLNNGFVNSVSTRMISTTADIPLLQELFWESIIDDVCMDILTHIASARSILKKVTIITEVTFLEALLIPLEQSARQAIHERDRARRFLKAIA